MFPSSKACGTIFCVFALFMLTEALSEGERNQEIKDFGHTRAQEVGPGLKSSWKPDNAIEISLRMLGAGGKRKSSSTHIFMGLVGGGCSG